MYRDCLLYTSREAYPHPYEALKALTRTNQAITEESIKEFIETLNVSEDIKKDQGLYLCGRTREQHGEVASAHLLIFAVGTPVVRCV